MRDIECKYVFLEYKYRMKNRGPYVDCLAFGLLIPS